MAWDREIELCLVICQDQVVANAYMDSRRHHDRLYVWAPRWSGVLGHNPVTTTFVCLGQWFCDPECERAFWWLRERGFAEHYPPPTVG